MNVTVPQERLIFADVLRITSAFFVVMIHVSAPFIYIMMDGSDMSAGSTVFLNVFSRFAVPVYFMLSGMFLLSEKSDCSVETVFRKRLPRILLPLTAWSFFYAAFGMSRRVIHTGG